jgi:hypothetical protein
MTTVQCWCCLPHQRAWEGPAAAYTCWLGISTALSTCLGRGKTPKLLGPFRRTCLSSAAIIFLPSPCLCSATNTGVILTLHAAHGSDHIVNRRKILQTLT